ncbi:MAG: hypothetical protein ACLSUR_04165 [Coprobacillus cateniformis]
MDDALFEIDNMCHALGFDPNEIRKGQKFMSIIEIFLLLVESIKKAGKS